MGFALPAALLRPRCALTAPFHPYPGRCPSTPSAARRTDAAEAPRGGIFSVALSVKPALSEPPRPLAGMLPYGDRTFLSRNRERLPVRQARIHFRDYRVIGRRAIGQAHRKTTYT